MNDEFDPVSDDRLATALRTRADEVMEGSALVHPQERRDTPAFGLQTDAPGVSRTKRLWLMGVASALLVVIAGGAVVVLDSEDSKPVNTPADGGLAEDPDLPPVPDPATSTPVEVVSAAMERTNAVSWVAEESAEGHGSTTLLYNPGSKGVSGGEVDSWVAMVSTDGVLEVPRRTRTESDEPRLIRMGDGSGLAECLTEEHPCAEGKWYWTNWGAGAPSTSAGTSFWLDFFDPASAEARGEGVYAVNQGGSSNPGSVLTLRIEDGLIRRLTYPEQPGAEHHPRDLVLSSFGTAPKIALPADSDIVTIDRGDSEFTEEMAANGERPPCTVSVRLTEDSSTATTNSGMSVENEVMSQLSNYREEVSSVDELIERALDTAHGAEVTGPAIPGCELERLWIEVSGPGGTFLSGGS